MLDINTRTIAYRSLPLRVSFLDSLGQFGVNHEFLLVCFKLPLKYGSENCLLQIF